MARALWLLAAPLWLLGAAVAVLWLAVLWLAAAVLLGWHDVNTAAQARRSTDGADDGAT